MATTSVHLTEALRGLASYPLRAALTALGIVIGFERGLIGVERNL